MVGLLDGEGFEMPRRVYATDGASPALRTCQGGGLQVKIIDETDGRVRVRFLTPLEYWRLMGFDDEDFACKIIRDIIDDFSDSEILTYIESRYEKV